MPRKKKDPKFTPFPLEWATLQELYDEMRRRNVFTILLCSPRPRTGDDGLDLVVKTDAPLPSTMALMEAARCDMLYSWMDEISPTQEEPDDK